MHVRDASTLHAGSDGRGFAVKTVTGGRDGNHDATRLMGKPNSAEWIRGIRTNSCCVAGQRFVVVFQVLEDRPPHRHFGRSMRGEAEAEAKNVCDVFLRKRSSVPLRQSREAGRWFPKNPRHGSVASALRAVTRRAVF